MLAPLTASHLSLGFKKLARAALEPRTADKAGTPYPCSIGAIEGTTARTRGIRRISSPQ